MSVSLPSNDRSTPDNEDGPGRCVNTDQDLTSLSGTSRQEAVVDIIATRSDTTEQAAQGVVEHLQGLLANAVKQRDSLVARGFDTLPDVEHHWFVSGVDGFCQACNLPRRNRRHVARPA